MDGGPLPMHFYVFSITYVRMWLLMDQWKDFLLEVDDVFGEYVKITLSGGRKSM